MLVAGLVGAGGSTSVACVHRARPSDTLDARFSSAQQGAFAKVWRAKCPSLDKTCAVKIIKVDKMASPLEEVQGEVVTMKMCNHRNVLACYACFVVKGDLWVVMPLMDKGSCFRILQELLVRGVLRQGQGLAEEWVACIMKEVLLGLDYFHRQHQIHRDIKAGNILINSDGAVRLADFGVSGFTTSGDKRTTFVGTPCWMAPEVMEQTSPYDWRADIWSFGITMLELAKGFAPYAKRPPMKVLLLTLQEDPPSLKTYADNQERRFSRQFKEVYVLCLQKDPKRRPSAKKLLSMKFFQKAPPISDMVTRLIPHLPDVTDNAAALGERMPGMGVLALDEGSGAAVKKAATLPDWDFPESMVAGAEGGMVVDLEELNRGGGEHFGIGGVTGSSGDLAEDGDDAGEAAGATGGAGGASGSGDADAGALGGDSADGDLEDASAAFEAAAATSVADDEDEAAAAFAEAAAAGSGGGADAGGDAVVAPAPSDSAATGAEADASGPPPASDPA